MMMMMMYNRKERLVMHRLGFSTEGATEALRFGMMMKTLVFAAFPCPVWLERAGRCAVIFT
jgi:hypothetical protein